MFTNLLLADEINRSPAKVQSALLEVMQERQVSIGGETHQVPEPFLVMATQNPIETEGTYPLPEAQVDRFMMKVLVDYPSELEEFVIVERMTGEPAEVQPVADIGELLALRGESETVYVDPSLIEYSVRLATATRRPDRFGLPELSRYITYGASPRASINLILTARALAFVRGRGVRGAAGRGRPGARRDAPPARAVLRGAGRRRQRRQPALEGPRGGAGPRRGAAQPCRSRCRSRRPTGNRRRERRMTQAARDPERILQRLDWTVIRRLDGLLQGDYRTLFQGFGLDLADLREYQFADDVRSIDWNVTARMKVPHVRR